MKTSNIDYNMKENNKKIFREFQSSCKFYSIVANEYGQQILKVTNEEHNNNMIVQYTSKEAKIGKRDSINVRGISQYDYSLDELISLGVEMLGQDAFKLKKDEKVLKRKKVRKIEYIK